MIFLDVDGTLIDHERAEREAARAFHSEHADSFPLSAAEFFALWHTTAERHVERYLAGETTFQGQRRARLRDVFRHARRELADEEADALFQVYLAHYEESWTLYPDVQRCLDALPGRDLGVITNGDPAQQRQKLAATGIAGAFATVVVSGDVGISKPDPRLFLHACRLAGKPAAACVYVGDRLETDALAAKGAGLTGVWLDRKEEGGKHAVTRITRLDELPAALDHLR